MGGGGGGCVTGGEGSCYMYIHSYRLGGGGGSTEPEFVKPKNRFQGINSARLCRLAGRYIKLIPGLLKRFPNWVSAARHCSEVAFRGVAKCKKNLQSSVKNQESWRALVGMCSLRH